MMAPQIMVTYVINNRAHCLTDVLDAPLPPARRTDPHGLC